MLPSEQEKRYVRAVNLPESTLDGELVMFSAEHGKYYAFNKVAAHIWKLLAEPKSLDDICAELMARYRVESDQCRVETVALLEQMLRDKLIKNST